MASHPRPRSTARTRARTRTGLIVTTLIALVGGLLVAAPVASGAQVTTDTLTIDSSATQLGRVTRDGGTHTCEEGPREYPGLFNAGTTYGYDTLTYVAPSSGCLTITRTSSVCLEDAANPDSVNTHLSLYAGAYDPADQATGFLSDQGSSSNASPFSFEVVKGQTYVLVASNTSAVTACTAGVELSLPPDTTILTGADNGFSPAAVTFTFEGTPDATSFESSLDAAPFAACTSPKTITGLAAGPHAFAVRALDGTSTPDASPATREFVTDLVGPDTAITAPAPGSHVTKPAVTAEFASPDADVDGFLCQLDGGDTDACTSPATFSGLSDGPHTLVVTAFDKATNNDPTPATVDFSSCNLAPKTAAVMKAAKAVKSAKKALKKAKKKGTKKDVKKAKKKLKKAQQKLKKAKQAKAACSKP